MTWKKEFLEVASMVVAWWIVAFFITICITIIKQCSTELHVIYSFMYCNNDTIHKYIIHIVTMLQYINMLLTYKPRLEIPL